MSVHIPRGLTLRAEDDPPGERSPVGIVLQEMVTR